jgi:hypothetical protein
MTARMVLLATAVAMPRMIHARLLEEALVVGQSWAHSGECIDRCGVTLPMEHNLFIDFADRTIESNICCPITNHSRKA